MINYRDNEEHDSCAIVAYVRKDGNPAHGTLKRAINALEKMGHRSGGVDGEGDGCGVQTDIPKELWAKSLENSSYGSSIVDDPRFFVGHFFLPNRLKSISEQLKETIRGILKAHKVEVLVEDSGDVRHDALGKMARTTEPEFWQVAGIVPVFDSVLDPLGGERVLFAAQLAIEAKSEVHVVSLSTHTVCYKVQGNAEILDHYYPQLTAPEYVTAFALGHSRYSTNTLSNFERVQPFALLGHNGEINTIDKLRREAQMLGIPITRDGSDSQDLDRAIHGLIMQNHLSLIEAMEIIFPPMSDEVDKMPDDLRALYRFYRWVLGPLAQGPAGIVTRSGDEAVFGVDALGLRPLWFVESGTEYVFSSEQGVLPMSVIISDPKPLAPGEKIAIQLRRGEKAEMLQYHQLQRTAFERSKRRFDLSKMTRLLVIGDEPKPALNGANEVSATLPAVQTLKNPANKYTAFHWASQDVDYIEALCKTGNEPIASLGYDGPLAALAPDKHSLADYFKEAVAVVTNPAMDREREVEHFSTRAVLGGRPHLIDEGDSGRRAIEIDLPVIIDASSFSGALSTELVEDVASKLRTVTLDGLTRYYGKGGYGTVPLTYPAGQTTVEALEAIKAAAVHAACHGATIITLDDTGAFAEDTYSLDPHLALVAVDQALRLHVDPKFPPGVAPSLPSLRRTCSIVLRSGGLRNLHDVIFAVGSGADAVIPTLMLEQVVTGAPADIESDELARRLYNLISALRKGLEKVISTMGTHELRGYGRIFASIGISREVARFVEMKNFCASDTSGLTFARFDEIAKLKYDMAHSETPVKKREDMRLYPKVWKLAGNAANGKGTYEEYSARVNEVETNTPVSLRHLLDFKFDKRSPIEPQHVSTKVDRHEYPIELSSMSFGSQGEIAFRSYAEAAKRLNIVCLNGEGGEIADMYGKYRHNRGQQIASGRFGVSIEMLNASDYLEIKIGQGAKPGEGGHLPGKKVSAKVAAARHATPGVDLISPSNNHDIYSIEDLAQIIEELHTANPNAKVSVKVPVVPNIGTIALGIAKAGADIITLSGYDGGTGAARSHALKYVGLPVEIGVKEAHRALTQAGVRDEVEIWCDGGMKTGADVVKMILLGANRCGFGTLTMVATGCTVCHGCQLDTCHVGIATQIETMEQAEAHGLKRFVPRDPNSSVDALCRLFGAIGEEVREITAKLGFQTTQEMVGQSDLLAQTRGTELIDCFELTQPVIPMIALDAPQKFLNGSAETNGINGTSPKRIRRGLSAQTKMITTLVAEQADAGHDAILYEDDRVDPTDRQIGTHLSGAIVRGEIKRELNHANNADLRFQNVIPGNGLGAFNSVAVNVRVQGGAQDGVAKGSMGGRVAIMKGLNDAGYRVDGSVGKGFGYGAIGGTFVIQGDADSRCGIRLSGASVIVGGEIQKPIDDSLGNLGARANIKGFAFEYMTSGRALVLGDPGPWMCAGMTGGTIYIRMRPDMDFDRTAVLRRIGRGANVAVLDLSDKDKTNIQELLAIFVSELRNSDQHEEGEKFEQMARDLWTDDVSFVKVVPTNQQVDQTVATE